MKETAGQRCATARETCRSERQRERERNNKITSLIHECKREQSHHVICNCSLNEKEGLSWKRRKVGVQKQRKIESAREREREKQQQQVQQQQQQQDSGTKRITREDGGAISDARYAYNSKQDTFMFSLSLFSFAFASASQMNDSIHQSPRCARERMMMVRRRRAGVREEIKDASRSSLSP